MADFTEAVVEYTLRSIGPDAVWVCDNCGACVISTDRHTSWHQAVLDAGIAKFQADFQSNA